MKFQRLPGPVGQGYRLVEYISVARVRPRTSKGVTDLLLPQTYDIFGTKDIFGHYKWKMCSKVKIVTMAKQFEIGLQILSHLMKGSAPYHAPTEIGNAPRTHVPIVDLAPTNHTQPSFGFIHKHTLFRHLSYLNGTKASRILSWMVRNKPSTCCTPNVPWFRWTSRHRATYDLDWAWTIFDSVEFVTSPWKNYQSWETRLSERFSLGRERFTWEGEILDYTRGFSPERELSRLRESCLAWARNGNLGLLRL
ncbi:hypothetical protein Lal_00043009 [Lupinus albus]|nr:hypothetical protein Lal_00043009 [Lupinus albus]